MIRVSPTRARSTRTYLEQIFSLVDRPSAAADAKAVMALETDVAKAQWPAADLRDAVKRYNKYPFAKLAAGVPRLRLGRVGEGAESDRRRGRDGRSAVVLQGLCRAGVVGAALGLESLARGAADFGRSASI